MRQRQHLHTHIPTFEHMYTYVCNWSLAKCLRIRRSEQNFFFFSKYKTAIILLGCLLIASGRVASIFCHFNEEAQEHRHSHRHYGSDTIHTVSVAFEKIDNESKKWGSAGKGKKEMGSAKRTVEVKGKMVL